MKIGDFGLAKLDTGMYWSGGETNFDYRGVCTVHNISIIHMEML